MKKAFLAWAAAVMTVLSLSCSESFDPKEEFKGGTVLYCVGSFSSGTASVINATLTRVYDVNGYDPGLNHTDPAISGAIVTLSAGGAIYQMKEDSLRKPDTLHYGTRSKYYRALGIPLRASTVFTVTAKLPDGETLTARTVLPGPKEIRRSPEFASGFITYDQAWKYGRSWNFNWDDCVDDNHLFFPRLMLVYFKYTDSSETEMEQPVPMQLVNRNGVRTPLYPTSQTIDSCSFTYEAIDWAMAAISAGDPSKNKYRPTCLRLDVVEFDAPLSMYYASVNGILDEYSIRLDESVYSNVSGGLGVFGTSVRNSMELLIDPRYPQRFGYQWQ